MRTEPKVPPNLTCIAPEKPDPFIVIVSPVLPTVGVKEVILGTCAIALKFESEKMITAQIESTEYFFNKVAIK